MEFRHDDEMDWYELRIFRGEHIIGYLHGYANKGWTPQVNNIWVDERFRRRKLATTMINQVESYFGQAPLPGTKIFDNEAARGFWKKIMERESKESGK